MEQQVCCCSACLGCCSSWRRGGQRNVAGRSDGLGGPDIRNAKSATERAVGGGPAGGAPSSREGQTLGVMAATASSWDGSHLGSHDAPGAEPVFHPEAVAPPTLSPQEQEDALILAVEAAKAERDDVALSRDSVLLAKLLIARSARSEAAALLAVGSVGCKTRKVAGGACTSSYRACRSGAQRRRYDVGL